MPSSQRRGKHPRFEPGEERLAKMLREVIWSGALTGTPTGFAGALGTKCRHFVVLPTTLFSSIIFGIKYNI